MRRMLLVLTVAAIMAAMLAATGGNAFATNSGDTGYEDGTLPYIERSLGGPDTHRHP